MVVVVVGKLDVVVLVVAFTMLEEEVTVEFVVVVIELVEFVSELERLLEVLEGALCPARSLTK